MSDDWTRVSSALTAAGIAGVEDFGRFVNNTKYFAPSRFDDVAAMPVLLQLLPTLTDRRTVEAAVRHLHGAWARPVAFQPLAAAFRAWAPHDETVGWAIGSSLAAAAGRDDGEVLLELAEDQRHGRARQEIVGALWRFRRAPQVAEVLERLIEDPDVALQAMSSLRRTIGNQAALTSLRRVRDSHPDPRVRRQAEQAARRAENAVARQHGRSGR